jgi:hypothetical protein
LPPDFARPPDEPRAPELRADGRELERLDFIAGRLLDLPLGRFERLAGLYPGLRVLRDRDGLLFTPFELGRVLRVRV